VQVLGERDVFEKRAGFSPMGFLKNPIMLIGGFGVLLMYFMPKLIENMDPEMRAEFDERQKQGGILNQLAGASAGQGGFDAAAFLAGSGSQTKSTGTDESKGGGKARKRG